MGVNSLPDAWFPLFRLPFCRCRLLFRSVIFPFRSFRCRCRSLECNEIRWKSDSVYTIRSRKMIPVLQLSVL